MPSIDLQRFFVLVCRAVVIGVVAALGGMLIAHRWLWDATGKLIAGDFVDVWAAGHMAHDGRAAQVYDWTIHKAAEVAAVGHNFAGYYGWHYPPPFLFIASAVARLPFVTAELVWVIATLGLFAVIVQKIVCRPEAWVAACAFPASLLNFAAGQNGFVTASLLGAFLLFARKRPYLSGLFLGLLAYKPQFGIVIPFVLIAAGRWQIVLSAVLTILAMIAASWIAFGGETWLAFAQSVAVTNHEILESGRAGFNKLQSLFGILMSLGSPYWLALMAQGAIAILVTVLTCLAWRDRRIEFDEKAALLVLAALTATPYVYVYDYPVLFIACAFLLHGGVRDRTEGALLFATAFPIAAFPLLTPPEPLAPLSTLFVAVALARRRFIRRAAVLPALPQTA
ncbi:MAG: glycosyltransferase family 87 protein [Rhizomicrobium sp.]